MWNLRRLLALALGPVVALSTAAGAQRLHFQIGGVGGDAQWADLIQEAIALDDTSFPGSLQPKELRPHENIVARTREVDFVNAWGLEWLRAKFGGEALGRRLGIDPRFWEGAGHRGAFHRHEVIDGDSTTSAFVDKDRSGIFTLDFGVETPVSRIVLFPLQTGIDESGVPNREGSPQDYTISIQRTPEGFLLTETESGPLRTLETIVAQSVGNSTPIIDSRFPLQPIRFIRVNLSFVPRGYALAEIEVFGEGVPSRARYLTTAIDLGQPVTFGELTYSYKTWRRNAEAVLEEDPQDAAQLIVEARTGTVPTTVQYLVVDDFGGEREVTKTEYDRAPAPRYGTGSLIVGFPGQKSGSREDRDNWSPWSSPHRRSGVQIRAPDGRQYLQLRLLFDTEDVLSIGRLDSIVVEYSPLLVAAVVGEVSLKGETVVPDDDGFDPEIELPAEAVAGVPSIFYYDILASFNSARQPGFDAVRLDVPVGSRLVELEMGDPLATVEPDSVSTGEGQIEVFFPSNRITRLGNHPIRLTLETALLNSNTFFTGNVADTESENLPQSIEPGDVREDVDTNSLQVFAVLQRLEVLADVRLLSAALTPNGDDVNDRVGIAFNLLFVEEADIEIDVLDLAGRNVRRLVGEARSPGAQLEWWNGEDEAGKVVPPGIYLVRIRAKTQSEDATAVLTAPVVY